MRLELDLKDPTAEVVAETVMQRSVRSPAQEQHSSLEGTQLPEDDWGFFERISTAEGVGAVPSPTIGKRKKRRPPLRIHSTSST